jgi:hypothetical protein
MIIEQNKVLRWLPVSLQEYSEETDEWNKYKLLYMRESSLSRIWQHMTNPNVVVGIISASRKENDEEQNKANTLSLKIAAQSFKLGYVLLTGHWVETDPTTGEKSKVTEDSIAVIGSRKDEHRMEEFLRQQADRFNQEGFLIKPPDTDHMFFSTGSDRSDIGTASLDKLGEMYSTLKKGSHAGRPFVFESAYVQKNVITIGAALSQLKIAGLKPPFKPST